MNDLIKSKTWQDDVAYKAAVLAAAKIAENGDCPILAAESVAKAAVSVAKILKQSQEQLEEN